MVCAAGREAKRRLPAVMEIVESRTTKMSEKAFVAAAKLEDVPAGGKKVVEINGVSVILVNTKDKIFAVRNLCRNAYEQMECGRVRAGWISCPVHGPPFAPHTCTPRSAPCR